MSHQLMHLVLNIVIQIISFIFNLKQKMHPNKARPDLSKDSKCKLFYSSLKQILVDYIHSLSWNTATDRVGMVHALPRNLFPSYETKY